MKSNKKLNVILNNATQMLKTGNKNLTIQFLSNHCKTEPDNADLPWQIGLYLQEKDMLNKAEIFYRSSLSIDNKQASIHFNLGLIYQNKNKFDQAISSYQQATEISPNHARAYANLGYLYHQAGEMKKCQDACLSAQKIEPENPQIKHMIAALGIEPIPETADQQYIKNLFNDYASYYDKDLSIILKSKIPELIYNAVSMHVNNENSDQVILDLGCGTGICGELFKQSSQKMVGVDLSEQMIAEAQKKNIYQETHISDITEYLKNSNQKFDIIISSDVFIYIGNLLNLFKAIYKTMKQDGLFSFSIESVINSDDDFILDSTGRYKQNHQYISRIAEQCDFTILSSKEAVLRQQDNQDVIGRIYVLNKK